MIDERARARRHQAAAALRCRGAEARAPGERARRRGMAARRDRQRGSMLPIMAGATLLLALVGVGSLTIVRVVLARQETQRVADAACLAATGIVKTGGLPWDGAKQAQAAAIAGANHPGMTFKVDITPQPETPDLFSFACTASADVSAPAMIWQGGKMTVTASAQAAVGQVTLTQASKKYPKLVLVLDYSGSMEARCLVTNPNWSEYPSDCTPKSIDVLETEVNKLLAKNYNIKLGLVLFSGTVFKTVPIALDNTQNVKNAVNANNDCPFNGEECDTASWDGLHAAHDLFGPWDNDEERYVLFISDGQPGTLTVQPVPDGVNMSEAQAKLLFDESHANIYTLQLINTKTDGDKLQAFMQDISGSPEHHPDTCNYFNADSQTSLDAVLTAIGNAIACPLKLDQPIPANTAVHVFLRDTGGAEEALGDASRVPLCSGAPSCGESTGSIYATTPGDLADQQNCTYYQGDYFLYYAPKQSIYVTPGVCDRILNAQETVVIRYAHTELTQ